MNKGKGECYVCLARQCKYAERSTAGTAHSLSRSSAPATQPASEHQVCYRSWQMKNDLRFTYRFAPDVMPGENPQSLATIDLLNPHRMEVPFEGSRTPATQFSIASMPGTPRSSGVYSPSSLHFFLCFSGFLRLSGTTFVAAGAAAALRASRRASLPLSSRFFFFRIPFLPPPSLHPTAIGTRLTSASCAPRNRINQVLRLAVLDPRFCISVAFPLFVRTSTLIVLNFHRFMRSYTALCTS